MRTVEQYLKLFKSFMPKGRFWNTESGTIFEKLLLAKSEEFVRIEDQSQELINESFVTRTTVLIDKHEADYGIPEGENDLAPTIEGRRADLHAKLLQVGGQHEEYFKEILQAIGYNVTIQEFKPFWAGFGRAGETVGDWFSIYHWIVYFSLKGDKGGFGRGFNPVQFDRLASNDRNYFKTQINTDLTKPITLLKKYKAAHTILQSRFFDVEFNRGFGRGFNSIPYYDGTSEPGGFDRGFGNGFANIRDYDGKFLIGGFSSGFSIGFDSHNGKGFERRGFSKGFG